MRGILCLVLLCLDSSSKSTNIYSFQQVLNSSTTTCDYFLTNSFEQLARSDIFPIAVNWTSSSLTLPKTSRKGNLIFFLFLTKIGLDMTNIVFLGLV